MAVVSFDKTAFLESYPEFATTATELLTASFNRAGLYCNNTARAVVTDLDVRTQLLWLLTAHIAVIFYGACGAPASQLVGRVSAATEGSVSVQTQYAAPEGTRAWYDQTKYGAAYWAASAPYRTTRYLAPTCAGRLSPFRRG